MFHASRRSCKTTGIPCFHDKPSAQLPRATELRPRGTLGETSVSKSCALGQARQALSQTGRVGRGPPLDNPEILAYINVPAHAYYWVRTVRYLRCSHHLERVSRVLLHVGADDLPDHGVLAHQHRRLTTKGVTDLGHLVRPDIVGLHGAPRDTDSSVEEVA